MTKSEMNRFQALLTAKAIELERTVRQRDGISIVRSADQLEEMQQASERTLAVGNLDRDYRQLRSVRLALTRIQDGTFGICQECAEPIHLKRLAALPWAACCVPCQEAIDSESGQTPPADQDALWRAA